MGGLARVTQGEGQPWSFLLFLLIVVLCLLSAVLSHILYRDGGSVVPFPPRLEVEFCTETVGKVGTWYWYFGKHNTYHTTSVMVFSSVIPTIPTIPARSGIFRCHTCDTNDTTVF